MLSLSKYSKLSDQDLVSTIKNHSSGDHVLTNTIEICLLKVEYERRLTLAKKSHSTLDVFLSSLALGLVITIILSLVFNAFPDPSLALFLPSRNFILCEIFLSILIFMALTYVVNSPVKKRAKERMARPNDFFIEKPEADLRLTQQEMKMLGDLSNELSPVDKYSIKAIQAEINKFVPRSDSNQRKKGIPEFMLRNLPESEFGMTSDWQLKEMLKKADGSQDLVTYGKIKLEFDRRDPVAWRSSFAGLIFIFVFLSQWAFIMVADSVFYFMTPLGRESWLYLALILAIESVVLVKYFYDKKISTESEMRNPSPPGFKLDLSDPVYRWKRGEISAIDAVLRKRSDLRSDDLASLDFFSKVKTTVFVWGGMILIAGALWVYKLVF